jgi:hypothetical protein
MPWRCELCTFVNYRDPAGGATACEMCGVVRRASAGEGKREMTQEPGQAHGAPQQAPLARTPSAQPPPLPQPATPAPQQQQQQQEQQQPKQQQQQQQHRGSERSAILEEILASERVYVDSLCILVTHFFQPLEAELAEGVSKPVLSSKALSGIFSNVKQLLQINLELLRVMEQKVGAAAGAGTAREEALSTALTEAFSEVLPYIKMYSFYVNSYPAAVALLHAEQSGNKAFAQFLKHQSSHALCKGLDLGAYLIMPVQRLCKYPLLFGRLVKVTPAANADAAAISRVAEVVSQITSTVDLDRDRAERALRGFEVANCCSLEALSKQLGQQLVLIQPGRSYLHEWSCWLGRTSASRSGDERKPRSFFLFSDVLVVTKKSVRGYDTRVWLPLAGNVLLSDLLTISSDGVMTPVAQPGSGGGGGGGGGSTPKRVPNAGSLTGASSVAALKPGFRKSLTVTGGLQEAIKDESHPFAFSLVVTEGSGSVLQAAAATLGRLSRVRKSPKTVGSETFTLWFADEAGRASAYHAIADAMRALHGGGPARPGSSRNTDRPRSMDVSAPATSPRRARSLSPQAHRAVVAEQARDDTGVKSPRRARIAAAQAQAGAAETVPAPAEALGHAPVPQLALPATALEKRTPAKRPPAPGAGAQTAAAARPPAPTRSGSSLAVSSGPSTPRRQARQAASRSAAAAAGAAAGGGGGAGAAGDSTDSGDGAGPAAAVVVVVAAAAAESGGDVGAAAPAAAAAPPPGADTSGRKYSSNVSRPTAPTQRRRPSMPRSGASGSSDSSYELREVPPPPPSLPASPMSLGGQRPVNVSSRPVSVVRRPSALDPALLEQEQAAHKVETPVQKWFGGFSSSDSSS